MRTIVLGANPQMEELIALRRSWGADRFDEVWEGEYHMAPAPSGPRAMVDTALIRLLDPFVTSAGLIGTTAFNLGDGPNDYRVPDGGYHRDPPQGVWIATAAIVVEIVSPDDETFAKFDFYATHGVEEIIVADPAKKTVRCFRRNAGTEFVESEKSDLLHVDAAFMTANINWP